MQNSCAYPATLKCKICEFPPCNCEKCNNLRSEGMPDQEEVKKCFRSSNDTTPKGKDSNLYANPLATEISNDPKKFVKEKLLGIKNFKLPEMKFTPTDLHSVLFDIVGIIFFFIMGTFMFWITISQYLWDFGHVILQWGRRAQLTTLVLLLLLCVSITFHAVKGRHHRYQTLKKPTDPDLNHNSTSANSLPKCSHCRSCQRRKCSHFNLQNSKGSGGGSKEQCDKCAANGRGNTSSNPILTKKQNPSLCDLCAKQMKPGTQSMLSDDEAREMYKRYRLYAIPTEMKTPPSLTNLMEFLTGIYNTMSGSRENANS